MLSWRPLQFHDSLLPGKSELQDVTPSSGRHPSQAWNAGDGRVMFIHNQPQAEHIHEEKLQAGVWKCLTAPGTDTFVISHEREGGRIQSKNNGKSHVGNSKHDHGSPGK